MTGRSDPAVIVGAGQAGGHAAVALRQAGHAGPIVLIGAEPHRPHERPPLSKAMLTEPQEPDAAYLHPEPHYAELGIDARLGTRAEAVDLAAATVRLSTGEALPYARLLLATGGQARRLSLPGAERVLYLRTLDDARVLRGRLAPGAAVVCIGAGVIGLEIASSARARGCRVTVVENGPTVMGRSLPPALSAWLLALHEAAGVSVRLDARVAAVTRAGVVLGDGTVLPADVVVAGIGMVRDTALAEAAGLAVDDGIEVDALCRTSAPGVFAAGDVAAFWVPRLGRRLRLETWRHAQDHGTAAGRAMAGQGTDYDVVPWFWTDQHGRNLQLAGEAAGRTVMRGAPGPAPLSAWFLDPDGRLAGVVGIDSPREVRAAQSLIRDGRRVDPDLLGDPAIPARRLVGA